MDAILSALLAKLPELGIAGFAVFLLIAAWRNAASDRGDYRAGLKAADERHDAELVELRADRSALRQQVDDLNVTVDLEREARRKAEDEAAETRRRTGGAP